MTFVQRAAEAAKTGAPLGVIKDTAQATSNPLQAKQVGSAFFKQAQPFAQPQPFGNQQTTFSSVPQFEKTAAEPKTPYRSPWDEPSQVFKDLTTDFVNEGDSFWDNVGSAWSKSAWFGLDVVSAPFYYTSRGVKTAARVSDLAHEKGDPFFSFGTSDDWSQAWNDSQNGTIGQYIWESTRQGNMFGSGPSYEKQYEVIDDPEANQAYFSQGVPSVVTGTIDLLSNVFLDPTVIGGKAASVAKASRLTLQPQDVERVMDLTVPRAALSSKQRIYRNSLDQMVDFFEEGKAGVVSSAAATRYFGEHANGNAALYLMKELDKDSVFSVADRETRRQGFYDIMGSMAGHGQSLENLRTMNTRLGLEAEALAQDPLAIDRAAFMNPNLAPDEQAEVLFKAANDTDYARREADYYRDVLKERQAAGETLATTLEGTRTPAITRKDLQKVTGQGGFKNKVSSINGGRFIRPLNIVTGQHLPDVVSLAKPQETLAHATEAVTRSIGEFRGMTVGYKDVDGVTSRITAEDAYKRLLDRLVTGAEGAAGRPAREATLRQLNTLTDDLTAKKYGVDPATFHAVANKVRAQRMGMTNQMLDRVYKAREAGDHYAMLSDGATVTALRVDTGMGDELAKWGQAKAEAMEARRATEGTPVLRSQQQDLVPLLNARELGRIANKIRNYGGVFVDTKGLAKNQAYAKRIQAGADRAARSEAVREGVESVLSTMSNFWKFAALFRVAYPLRIQVDTQARVLSRLGPMEYFLNLGEGLKNYGYNNFNRVSQAVVSDREQRFMATARMTDLQSKLRNVDMAQVGRAKMTQGKMEQARTLTAQQKRDLLREERFGRYPLSGKFKPITAAQKEAIKLEAEAAHTQRLTQMQGQFDREIAGAGPFGLDEIQALRDEMTDLQQRLKQPLAQDKGRKTRIGGTNLGRHIGQNYKVGKDGKVRLPSLKERALNPYDTAEDRLRQIRSVNADESTVQMFTSRTKYENNARRGSGLESWHYVEGRDPGWYEAWSRDLRQAKTDALGRRAIQGDDPDTLAHWLNNDPKGRQYLVDMRRFAGDEIDADSLAQNVYEHIETLAPAGSAARERLRLGGAVTKEDADATWLDPQNRAVVPGQDAKVWQPLDRAKQGYQDARSKYFNLVSTIPENVVGRHPFYRSAYRVRAQALVADIGEGNLTLEKVNAIRRQASHGARQDLQRTLFDVSQQSNLANTMRFISPFYAAWADTMRKWSRIFADEPHVLAIAAKIPQAPRAMGLVTDEHGNLVGADGRVRDEEGNLILDAEGQAKRLGLFDGNITLPGFTPWWQERSGQKNFTFTASSANIIFQGEPFWLPGNGPLVTVPMSELVNQSIKHGDSWYPEDDDKSPEAAIMRYILPYGPSTNVVEGSFPNWARAARDVLQGTGARNGALEYAQLYANQMVAEEQGLAEPLSDEERAEKIANQTKNSLLLRFFGTFVAPVSLQPNSPLDYYRRQFQQNVNTMGYEKGREKFLEDYPEYLDLTIGLTANTTGLQANDETATQMARYRTEMGAHADLAWFWAGAATLAPGFNDAVYNYQLTTPVGPGTNETFRTRKDPSTVAEDIQVAQGWQQFIAMNTAVTTRMRDLGLTSLRQGEAADLADYKSGWIEDFKDANPAWAQAYDAQNSVGHAQEIVRYAWKNAGKIEKDPMLGYEAWKEFFVTRQAFQERMEELGVGSLNSDQAADLSLAWDAAMEDLASRSDAFNVAWSRGLASDDLSGQIYEVVGE